MMMALVVLGRYLMIFKECVKCSGEKHQQHTSNNHDTSNNKEKGNKFQKKRGEICRSTEKFQSHDIHRVRRFNRTPLR